MRIALAIASLLLLYIGIRCTFFPNKVVDGENKRRAATNKPAMTGDEIKKELKINRISGIVFLVIAVGVLINAIFNII